MAKTIIRGVEHAWSHIRVMFGANEFQGLTEIAWDTEQESEFHKGQGGEVVSYSSKSPNFKGQFKMLNTEMTRLRAAVPKGASITQIAPFTIVVTIKTPDKALVTYKLENVLLQNDAFTMALDATKSETTVNFKCSNITNN